MPPPRHIWAGTRVSRLVVGVTRKPRDSHVLAFCDCGKRAEIPLSNWGRTRSCGCFRSETTIRNWTKHGGANTKIYRIWADMVARCTRSTHHRYFNYGGRGITVCERWLTFSAFYADMGDRPEGRSLDRVDNNAGYSPENCRWATYSQQAKNRRRFGYEMRGRDDAGRFLPGQVAS